MKTCMNYQEKILMSFSEIAKALKEKMLDDLHKWAKNTDSCEEDVLAVPASIVIDVYNRFQDDLHDGFNCVLSILNGNDLKACVKNDSLTAEDIAMLWNHYKEGSTEFFLCDGVNGLRHFASKDDVVSHVEVWLWDAIEYMLKYFSHYDEFRKAYEYYITEILEEP